MRTMDEKRETGIAVLIDGENVGASFAGKVLGILRSLGRIDIGNVYFDLQRGQSVEWIRDLPSLPLEPVVTAVEETGRSGSDIVRKGSMSESVSPMVFMYLEQTGLLNPQVTTVREPTDGWWY